MNRYKQIKFKILDKGSDQKYFDEKNSEKFNTSLGLVSDIETGRLKLAEDFAAFEVANAKPWDSYCPTSCVHYVGSTEYLYHLVERVGPNNVQVYRQTGYAAPVTQYSLAAGSKEPSMIVSFNGKIIGWYKSSAGVKRYSWSNNDGVSFFSDDWEYSEPIGYKITSDDGKIYVSSYSQIVYSDDGSTWTVFYTATKNKRIIAFDELDGERYAILRKDLVSDYYYFVKFDNNDEPVIIREFYSQKDISMKVFDGRVIISVYVNDVISFYAWDKSELKKFAFLNFASLDGMKFLNADQDFLIFQYCTNGDKSGFLMKINCFGGIFPIKEFDLAGGTNIHVLSAVKFKGNLSIQFWDEDTNDFHLLMHRNDASETKQATGYYCTPVIDVGRHIPCYILVKHKPLGDDASVVVKAKSDQGAIFAVTCINNITNDSVYKEASLKSLLNEVDFIEFEVTLADSGNKGEIEDLEMIYLYHPTGLENSK